jgi:hypothetical protein
MPMHRASLALILLASVACSTGTTGRVKASPAPAPTAASVARADAVTDGSASVAESDRMLVRRAAMDVVVGDVAQAAARTQVILVSANGYVERGQRSERSASFTIRVPEPRLEATLDSLGTLGRVASHTVSAEDVTEESIDLDARLAALTAERDRLKQLLDRATTISEVMAVEREVARVQGEVDSLAGRLKQLRSSAAMASVDLSIRQKVVLGPLGYLAQGLGTLLAKLFVIR